MCAWIFSGASRDYSPPLEVLLPSVLVPSALLLLCVLCCVRKCCCVGCHGDDDAKPARDDNGRTGCCHRCYENMCTILLPTALAVASVRLSVRLSVCPSFFPLYLSNQLTFELDFSCLWVRTIACLGLKVKVIGQGHRSMSSANGPGNAVTRSVWPRSLIENSFSSC